MYAMYNDTQAMLVLYGLCAIVIALIVLAAVSLKKNTLLKISEEVNKSPFCCEYCDHTKRIITKLNDETVVGEVVFGGGYMLGIWSDEGQFIASRKLLPQNVAYVEAMNNAAEQEVAR